jgi:hypothetical protein
VREREREWERGRSISKTLRMGGNSERGRKNGIERGREIEERKQSCGVKIRKEGKKKKSSSCNRK